MDDAARRASAHLFAQAERQFAEVRHEITFPHAAGFTGEREKQQGDLFARATIANLCLDLAALVNDAPLAAEFRAVARREAVYLAGAKLSDRGGGWSYFPDLPELPPDADSLAAVLTLFLRTAPEFLPLTDEPVANALASAGEDGSLETWILAPSDAPQSRGRMEWAIRTCWGQGTDPDVIAHFYHALFLRARDSDVEIVRRGAKKLLTMQRPNGPWNATWYAGPAFGTALALRLLRETAIGEDARNRAREYLIESQRTDGSWGTPLETALSLWALEEAGMPAERSELQRGRAALVRLQLEDGSWPASPWIRMEIGRATGTILRVLTYQSVTITTAFCLKALLRRRG